MTLLITWAFASLVAFLAVGWGIGGAPLLTPGLAHLWPRIDGAALATAALAIQCLGITTGWLSQGGQALGQLRRSLPLALALAPLAWLAWWCCAGPWPWGLSLAWGASLLVLTWWRLPAGPAAQAAHGGHLLLGTWCFGAHSVGLGEAWMLHQARVQGRSMGESVAPSVALLWALGLWLLPWRLLGQGLPSATDWWAMVGAAGLGVMLGATLAGRWGRRLPEAWKAGGLRAMLTLLALHSLLQALA